METELSRIFILLSDSIAADDWEGVMTTNSCKPNLSREIKGPCKNRNESTPYVLKLIRKQRDRKFSERYRYLAYHLERQCDFDGKSLSKLIMSAMTVGKASGNIQKNFY